MPDAPHGSYGTSSFSRVLVNYKTPLYDNELASKYYVDNIFRPTLTFLGLLDTPNTYVPFAHYRANSSGTALEAGLLVNNTTPTSGNILAANGQHFNSVSPLTIGLMDLASSQTVQGVKTFTNGINTKSIVVTGNSDYGIDLNGSTIAVGDIRLSNGAIISNTSANLLKIENDNIVVVGSGITIGEEDANITFSGSGTFDELFGDFIGVGKCIETKYRYHNDFDEKSDTLENTMSNYYWSSSDSDEGIVSINNSVGGALVLDSSSSSGKYAVAKFRNTLFSISKNPEIMFRFSLNSLTNANIQCGWYANSTNYFLIEFDSSDHPTRLSLVSNSGSTEVRSELAKTLSANTYVIIIIRLFSNNTFELYIDGEEITKDAAGNNINYTMPSGSIIPYFKVVTADSNSKVLSIDYVDITQDR